MRARQEDEAQLASALVGRDCPWFPQFFEGNAVRVTRLAYLLGAGEPEDVAQEAFLKLLEHRHRLPEDADLSRYLNRIVVNEVRSRHRRNEVRKRLRGLLHSGRHVTDEGTAQVDAAADVLTALRRLTPAQRQVIVLHYWSDLTLHQIAELTGRPHSTVKSHHRRALARLQIVIGADA